MANIRGSAAFFTLKVFTLSHVSALADPRARFIANG